MQTVDLRDIAFEAINDDYSWGNYIDFKVIIMRKNGYINVTKLCKEGGKELTNWRKANHAEELLNEISSSIPNGRDDLLTIITGGQEPIIRGTYAHPALVPHIASWISPKFAVKVSFIVNNYAVKQERDRQEAEKAKLRGENSALQDTINMLKEMNRKIDEDRAKAELESKLAEERFKELCRLHGLQLDINRETRDELTAVRQELVVTNTELEVTNGKLNAVVERIVPELADYNKQGVFIILKKKKYDPETDKYGQYYAIRAQRKAALKSKNSKRKEYKMIYYEDEPSPQVLFNRVKEELHELIIITRVNYIKLLGNTTEAIFLDRVEEIRQAKYRECAIQPPARNNVIANEDDSDDEDEQE